MKKLAILCVLACALVACEKPTNEEAGEKQFTQAVQNDLEVLNGTFVRIGTYVKNEETITFVPFSQPVSKTGSESGDVVDVYGTFQVDDFRADYFYIKPASAPQKSEIFFFTSMENDTVHYNEKVLNTHSYYTIIDKDTIILESIYPRLLTKYVKL